MLKITKYASQFDLYILKWPKACMSCGSTNVDNVTPRYKTVDSQHIKTSGLAGLGGETKTTVKTMMKMKLYLCLDCRQEILKLSKIQHKKFEKAQHKALGLRANPYDEFIGLKNDGRVVIADSAYIELMKELNPDLKPEKMKNPLVELRKEVPKDAEIPAVTLEEIESHIERDIIAAEKEEARVAAELEEEDYESTSEDDEELIQLKQNFEQSPRDYDRIKDLAIALGKRNRCKEIGNYLKVSQSAGWDMKKLPELLKILKEYCE